MHLAILWISFRFAGSSSHFQVFRWMLIAIIVDALCVSYRQVQLLANSWSPTRHLSVYPLTSTMLRHAPWESWFSLTVSWWPVLQSPWRSQYIQFYIILTWWSVLSGTVIRSFVALFRFSDQTYIISFSLCVTECYWFLELSPAWSVLLSRNC